MGLLRHDRRLALAHRSTMKAGKSLEIEADRWARVALML